MSESALAPPTKDHLAHQREEEILQSCFSILCRDSVEPASPEALLAKKTIEESLYQLENPFDASGETLLKYEKESFEEKRMARVFERFRPKIADLPAGSPATVSQSEFSTRFHQCSHGLLEGLDWTNIFVAGGSILACLLPTEEHEYSHADVDIFLLTRDTEEADRLTRHIYDVIASNVAKTLEEPYQKIETFKTRRTVSIKTAFKVFQIVTTLFACPLEVLIGFDVDCGAVGTLDGKTAVLTKRAKLSICKRYNLWMLDSRPQLAVEKRYQKRLFKYGKRGFAVLIPFADWSKLPNFDKKKLDDFQGVARIVYFDRILSLDNVSDATRHMFVSGIEECIHGGDSFCHSCHKKLAHAESNPSSRISFSTPIFWELENVVYQDIEGGKLVRDIGHHYTPQIDFEYYVYDKTKEDGEHNGSSETPKDAVKSEEPQAGLSTTSLSTQQGIVTPNCYCGLLASLKASKKEGPNFRRRFFCCPHSMLPSSCKFFQWEGYELNYEQARAQRLRDKVDEESISQVFMALDLDASKQLLIVASCYKSGRITAEHRSALKDVILGNPNETPLDPFFSEYAQHMDLDRLALNLTHYCKQRGKI